MTEALQLTGGEQTLLDRVAAAETVLVLDNCEHVLDGVADLATRLLDGAAPLRILAPARPRSASTARPSMRWTRCRCRTR
ncbi:MAG TPA: hypothetical protein VFJ69_13905 [Actinomycetota bacterium]|nr:hypothetical protein [Actinomycetota bacterium]